MAHKGYRDSSRDVNWGTAAESLTMDQINCGSLLRIADATEKMALRHTELIGQRDRFEREAAYYRKRLEVESRRTAALRGVINRMKRRAKGGK